MTMTEDEPSRNGTTGGGGGSGSGDYGYKKDLRTTLPQILSVSAKNLMLLGYGMTLGFSTILIPAVSNPTSDEKLKLGPTEISWISSLNLIVVPLGCALSGMVSNPMGRRRAMQIYNLPFFVAWLLLHFAYTSTHLYIALFLTGLAGGLLEAPVLTYVAEVTQPHLRGALSATASMCIILGVLMQFLLGIWLAWRNVALVNIAFTVLAVVALAFIPESPHWLVARERMDKAKENLKWLRGWTTDEKVEDELADIQKIYSSEKALKRDGSGQVGESMLQSLANYTERGFILPFLLVTFAFFVGHFCGMTSLQTYAVLIFQRVNAPIDKYYATLILGAMQLFGAFICVVLVHYTGKRPLTIVSLIGTAACCSIVAGYDFYINGENHVMANATHNVTYNNYSTPLEMDGVVSEKPQYTWVPMASLIMLAGWSHIGIRLLPWILIGEVFPAKVRSGASGISGAFGYLFAFLSNKYFKNMLDAMSISGTYGLYAVISITGAIAFYFILPETEGVNLIDIEHHFAGIKKLTNKESFKLKERNVPEKTISTITLRENPSMNSAL